MKSRNVRCQSHKDIDVGCLLFCHPLSLVISCSPKALEAFDVPLTPWHDAPGYVSWIFKMHLKFSMFKTALFSSFTPVTSSLLLLLPLVFMVIVNCSIRNTLFKPEYYSHPGSFSLFLKSDNNICPTSNSFSLLH